MSKVIERLEEWYRYNKDSHPQETIDNFATTEDIGKLIADYRKIQQENKRLKQEIGGYAGTVEALSEEVQFISNRMKILRDKMFNLKEVCHECGNKVDKSKPYGTNGEYLFCAECMNNDY